MKHKYPLLTIRGRIDYFPEQPNTLDSVDEKLDDLDGELIYVLLESNGGDPSLGYRIMRLIEAKYKKIIMIIPAAAYSTATLMALGSDEIYMRKSACLGPLDMQLEHPADGSMVSSLEIRDALSNLAGATSSYAGGFYESLRQEMGLGKKDAADLAMRAATDLVKPLAEKLDPIYLQLSRRSAMLGQKYAEELLSARMLKHNTPLAQVVCRFLTNRYYYHGYAITQGEAVDLLGLTVHDVTDLDVWDKIKTIYKLKKDNDRLGVFLDTIEIEDAVEPPKTASASVAKDDKINKGAKA